MNLRVQVGVGVVRRGCVVVWWGWVWPEEHVVAWELGLCGLLVVSSTCRTCLHLPAGCGRQQEWLVGLVVHQVAEKWLPIQECGTQGGG